MPKRFPAHVSQDHCRQADEVGASQARRIEAEADLLRAEFVAVQHAVLEAHSVQVPDRSAMGRMPRLRPARVAGSCALPYRATLSCWYSRLSGSKPLESAPDIHRPSLEMWRKLTPSGTKYFPLKLPISFAIRSSDSPRP